MTACPAGNANRKSKLVIYQEPDQEAARLKQLVSTGSSTSFSRERVTANPRIPFQNGCFYLAVAKVIAAASPFGPEPIIAAVGMGNFPEIPPLGRRPR